VLVVLLARFFALPLPDPEPEACVPLVVDVFWPADVFWFVVALGLMVTLLCGIALNFASVLTEVFALGATDWPAVVLVLLLALLLVVCAIAAPLNAAQTAAPITVKGFVIMRVSSQ
jgi:hypothetical protein